MSNNDIHISVGGEKFTGWKSVKVSTSLETLASEFSLTVTDKVTQKNNSEWPIRPQDECIISIGDDKLITGYIDDVSSQVSKNTHDIQISGRDRTADLIDCSYIESPRSWSKTNLLNLCNAIGAPFGITASLGIGVDISKTFQFTVNTNSTAFENISKKAKDLGILLLSDVEGNLLLANSGSDKVDDVIQYGVNIIEGKINNTYIDRFSKYIMQAQASRKLNKANWGTNISIKAETTDDGIKRYRPLLIKNGRPLTRSIANKAVQWEASIRAAKSQTVDITLQGFRRKNNELWKINKLVDVYAPPLYINPTTELLIIAITYMIDANGSFSMLQLKRKDAYTSKPEIPKSVPVVNSLGWDIFNKNKSGGVPQNLEVGL